ncbi:MAG TPA: FKBP-type peptidyl-prolyl cis-trans isomerase [Bacteroidia bacterium]|jgi:FKBP-type peptidyl-prolyl cis-trans isomerase SlyD|nr:FKBP-type peptidyl-prolyl cis-trans isomerase [Bacteroidia bacterium]
MKVENNKVVAVNYKLSAKKGNEPEIFVEETSPEHPFVFLFGSQQVIPDFEKNLEGKSEGDSFDFTISAENAYGSHQADYVVKLDKTIFVRDGEFDSENIKVGNNVPMYDKEGNELIGKVLEVGLEHVTMDFNHPLADYDLHFTGTIKSVREATPEELTHGHAHGITGNESHHH